MLHAWQIALVPHVEMTCVVDLSNQFLKGRQGRDLSRFQQRLFAFGSDVTLHQSQPLRHTDTRAFRSYGFLLQVYVRQQTFRCLLGHDIRQTNLSCWIANGPTSSRCDLTLMTYVLPLRPSINRKRIDHRSQFGPYSSSPVCVTPFVTYFASIESWMLVFSSTRPSA